MYLPTAFLQQWIPVLQPRLRHLQHHSYVAFSGGSASGLVSNLASSVVSSPSPGPDSNWPVWTVPIHRHELRCVPKTTPLDSVQFQCPQYCGLQDHCLELSGTEPRTRRSTITVPSLAPATMNGVSTDASLSLN